MKDVEKYILESIENIKEDRDVTKSLLKVKVVALMQKRVDKSSEFTDEDKAEIFELLKESN